MATGQYSIADVQAPPAQTGQYSSSDLQDGFQGNAGGFLDAVSRFGQGFYDKTLKGAVDTLGLAGHAIMHPEDTASAIASSPIVQHPLDTAAQAAKDAYQTHVNMLQQAKQSFQKGDYDDAIQRGTNALIPILGPSIQASVDKAKGGDMAGGLGELAGMLSSVAAAAPGAPEAAASAIGDVASRVGDAAKTIGTFTKAAVPAAAPDIAKGAGKIAGGYALAHVPMGSELTSGLAGGSLVGNGALNVVEGIGKGVTAGKQAVATLNKIRNGVADLRGVEAPAPIELTPETAQAWNEYSSSQPVAQAATAPKTGSTASSQSGNPFETSARADKAQKLASFLYLGGNGVTSEEAAMMSPDHWKLAAQGAGTTIPSPATAKAAITQLQKLWDAHAAAQQLSDSMTPPGGPPR